MQNITPHFEEDTIDIRELLAVLKRRKKLIYLLTALFTLLAITYVFITKPVYEVKSMIELGQIDSQPIANVQDIKQKLEYKYQVNVKKKKIKLPRVNTISVPKKSTNIFQVTAIAYSNQDAITFIDTVIDSIEKEYKEKIDAYIHNQKELMALTENDIRTNTKTLSNMRSELKTYNSKIISLKSEDAALAGIYALQIGQKQTELQKLTQYISTLNTKKQDLELSISPFKMKQTHIVGQIETLEKPIKPKKALTIIIAFITGLMFSVFLAFFLEFVAGIKEEKEN